MNAEIKGNEIILFGRLTRENADTFKQIVSEAETDLLDEIILNFENVDYINSAGIGGVISVYKMLCDRNKKLTLIKLKHSVFSVFKIAGLIKILNINEEN
ncbi:MAG: STAS domain-containing protein [Rhodothermaceae bacterium]